LQSSSPVHEIPQGQAWWQRRTEVAVDAVFFWLAVVGGDGRQRAANDG
jgi:hypothetical protein